ncbi:LacI family DNA-binding transcriptional regulator [Nocardiopsis salina]|uniref:LacI family DNA-binding transcriptional regulator n=1 Tax=Nocardiopsis salina TaxID=245836 RepID=UPI001955444D|nr:LacI family DNA-binding transcriptional regulator [Nocardiopsis salina]
MHHSAAPLRRPCSAAAVARAAGVSTATVSYVMNGKPGVSEALRHRILTLAKEMGHRPRAGDDLPTPQRNRVIGLVVPNMINPMFSRWAHGVVEHAEESGHEVFLATSKEDPERLTRTVRALVARRVDGLILTSVPREDVGALSFLQTVRVPYVQLSRKSDFVPGDFVGVDDTTGAHQVMEHVLDHGLTRVATVIGPRTSSASAARERGFLAAAAAREVPVPPHWRISTSLDNLGGRRAAHELLEGGQQPDAVVCGSDEVAIGVMEYLLKHGVRTPEEVAVTGFDGLPHSRSELIGMTTVVQPQAEMAQCAFDLLQQRLNTPGTPYQSIILPHQWWSGRSCGCPSDPPHTQ